MERKGFLNEIQYFQVEELLFTFLLLQQNLSIHLNPLMLDHLFIIAIRVHSLSSYHFIHFNKRCLIYTDNDSSEKDLFSQIKENEAQTFYLLHSLLNSVLSYYPFVLNYTHDDLLQDCSSLTCYLLRYQKNTYDFIQIYSIINIKVLKTYYLNHFSMNASSTSILRYFHQKCYIDYGTS